MSPHKIDVLPSPAALSSYGISKNGFLPEEAPLTRLPNVYYQPWESIMNELPTLIEEQQIRQRIDELPVLDTSYLDSEPEWQRAYSMLAVFTQGYVWTGPEPSEVSCTVTSRVRIPSLTTYVAIASCYLDSIPRNSRIP